MAMFCLSFLPIPFSSKCIMKIKLHTHMHTHTHTQATQSFSLKTYTYQGSSVWKSKCKYRVKCESMLISKF